MGIVIGRRTIRRGGSRKGMQRRRGYGLFVYSKLAFRGATNSMYKFIKAAKRSGQPL